VLLAPAGEILIHEGEPAQRIPDARVEPCLNKNHFRFADRNDLKIVANARSLECRGDCVDAGRAFRVPLATPGLQLSEMRPAGARRDDARVLQSGMG